MEFMKKCHDLMRSRHVRVVTSLKIDDGAGAINRLSGKINPVEQRLGRRVTRS